MIKELEYIHNGSKYILELNVIEDNKFHNVFKLTVYFSLDPDSGSSTYFKEIKKGKILWNDWDHHITSEVKSYFDRMIKLKVFF